MLKKLITAITCLMLSGTALAYTSAQTLSMDADDLDELRIVTRSGDLVVFGTDSDRIEVELVIQFSDNWDDNDAEDVIKNYLVFSFDRRRDTVVLRSYFDYGNSSFLIGGFFKSLFSPRREFINSHLEIKLPRSLELDLTDGSGAIIISDINANVRVSDGSGEIEISNISGDLRVKDGSGSIHIDQVEGFVEINDGSGDINVRSIGNGIRVRDGSGSILVQDIIGDVHINDGSGNITVRNLRGSAIINDGSGDINVSNVDQELIITDGSGSVNTSNIKGRIKRS